MTDTTGYSPKDAKIIRDNEGKSPYELLELGLSQRAFDRLTLQLENERSAPQPKTAATGGDTTGGTAAGSEAKTDNAIKPAVVEKVPGKTVPAKPALTSYSAPAMGTGTVKIVGPTGIPQVLNSKQANKLVAKNPDLYRIID